MRRAAILCLSLLAVTFGGMLHADAASRPAFNDADKADLARVSAYLNSIHTMKGGFVQIDPDGNVDQGTFEVSKPGRMRFEYKPPTPTLIVSDGRTVAIQNTKLKTIDRYPLTDTPLDLVLGDNVDLANDKSVVGIVHDGDSLVVKARSHSSRTQGNISMVFAEPELELRQWTVIDNQGLSTTVALRDLQTGVDLPASLFILPDKNPFAHKQGD
jgi:outer membrane lipoprotein-sorting protein